MMMMMIIIIIISPLYLINHTESLFLTASSMVQNIVTWQLKSQNNAASRICPLLDNGSINMYCSNRFTCDKRGTVGNSASYAVHPNTIQLEPPSK
jgi:hypothetical protein